MKISISRDRDVLNTFMSGVLIFSIVYMIGFPKGGVKIYGIPLTIGYILSGLLLILAMTRIDLSKIPINRVIVIIFAGILSFWSWGIIFANGFQKSGFALAYFIATLYLPIFGMIAFSGLIMDKLSGPVLLAIKISIRFVILYGIFLFIFKYITGSWIEIPYLTVNADDIGSLDDKYINRGGIFKLISTYNNGNIFGVCMAIIGPIYLYLEENKIFKITLMIAMLLTLSRTVWIAMILINLFSIASQGRGVKQIFNIALFTILGLVSLSVVLAFMGRDLSFLFDKNLGGRAGMLFSVSEAKFIPTGAFKDISEIVYVGVLNGFGFFGLVLFLLYLLSPIALLLLGGTPLFSRRPDSACLQGLVIYAIIACSDGAFSYIPVMMIYWMVAGLGFWYQREVKRRFREAR